MNKSQKQIHLNFEHWKWKAIAAHRIKTAKIDWAWVILINVGPFSTLRIDYFLETIGPSNLAHHFILFSMASEMKRSIENTAVKIFNRLKVQLDHILACYNRSISDNEHAVHGWLESKIVVYTTHIVLNDNNACTMFSLENSTSMQRWMYVTRIYLFVNFMP